MRTKNWSTKILIKNGDYLGHILVQFTQTIFLYKKSGKNGHQ